MATGRFSVRLSACLTSAGRATSVIRDIHRPRMRHPCLNRQNFPVAPRKTAQASGDMICRRVKEKSGTTEYTDRTERNPELSLRAFPLFSVYSVVLYALFSPAQLPVRKTFP